MHTTLQYLKHIIAGTAFFALAFATASLSAWDGDGTKASPYLIASRADLDVLSDSVNVDGNTFLDSYFLVTADINMDNGSGNPTFIPIGHGIPTEFQGTFDGGNKTISNLYIYQSSVGCAGLFGTINSGIIRNVRLVNVDVRGGNSVGGLVGANAGSDIINCSVSGTVTGTFAAIGGLVGYNVRTFVYNCSSSCTVYGKDRVGGLIGESEAFVESCVASGNVIGSGDSVGGFIGQSYDGSIWNCAATGNVEGAADYVGGFIGFIRYGDVACCSGTGNVSGVYAVGGFIGESHSLIADCYSLGNVDGNRYVGGFIGHQNGSIRNSYCAGKANDTAVEFGAFIGNAYLGLFTNVYFDAQVADTTRAIGVGSGTAVGLTTAEMTLNAAFVAMLNAGRPDAPWTLSTGSGNKGYPMLSTGALDTGRSIGEWVTVSGLTVNRTSKLQGRYAQPYGKAGAKLKNLALKMATDNVFEVKGFVKLLNTPEYKKALKAKAFTQNILAADTAQFIQMKKATVTVSVKKSTDSKSMTFAMVPPTIAAVAMKTATVKGKTNHYAVVSIQNGGTKIKASLEQGSATRTDGKLAAAFQKYDKLPADIKATVDAATYGDPSNGIFVFKLNSKYHPAAGRFDLVVNNKNGLAAITLP